MKLTPLTPTSEIHAEGRRLLEQLQSSDKEKQRAAIHDLTPEGLCCLLALASSLEVLLQLILIGLPEITREARTLLEQLKETPHTEVTHG